MEKTPKEETPCKLKAFAKESKGSALEKSLVSSPVSKSPTSKPVASASKTPSPGRPLFQNTPTSQASCSPSSHKLIPKDSAIIFSRVEGENLGRHSCGWTNINQLVLRTSLGQHFRKVQCPWAKDDNGAFFKAALLSGPPGVDARSKRTLDEVVSELLSNKTLAGFTK
ncbi:uncharacterized protein LOC119568689, partial [Penaeus monodon]|uniref:uncharacterized protein LOC119568689 n=1 Tax=Penaeus monodon TaxID=6687 RepID=UPI0018A6F202